MTDDAKADEIAAKYSIYTSRDVSESYGEMTHNLVDTVVKAAVLTLPPAAHKALSDYNGGTEIPVVYIVRARDEEGVLDLAIQFVARRCGVCFWDELEPEKQAGHYFVVGIDYERNQGASQ
jgi:hypothetical protein